MASAPQPSVKPGSPAQRGLADLTLEYRAGRTRLTGSRTRPPLLVQQALYPDEAAPDLAYVFLANPTGGLLQNDRQEICVNVGPDAKAHVTTQSATKIHTMPDGVAEQRISINVATSGYLEYLPDPLIPFRNASLVQTVSITVAPGGALVYGDVLTPGRVASGEVFQYRKISNRLAVYRQRRRPVYVESFDLAPPDIRPMSLAVLGAPDCDQAGTAAAARTYASLLILCDAALTRSVLDAVRASMPADDGAPAGASTLPDGNGVGVKIIGPDGPAVQSAVTRAWSNAREQLLGAPAPNLRKY